MPKIHVVADGLHLTFTLTEGYGVIVKKSSRKTCRPTIGDVSVRCRYLVGDNVDTNLTVFSLFSLYTTSKLCDTLIIIMIVSGSCLLRVFTTNILLWESVG